MKFSQKLLIMLISLTLYNTAHSSSYTPQTAKFVKNHLATHKTMGKLGHKTQPKEHKPSKSTNRTKYYTMTGIASYYGPGFHGKKTSSGEILNQNALTAAHRTIPFNSYINVTNLKNHKSVVVRVNDHGPKLKSRILDISVAGARALGFIKNGIVPVSLQVVNRPGYL